MSTDTPETALIPTPRKGYAFFEHHNSNNARRREHGRIDGGLSKSHVTIRVVRHPEGGPLPHLPTPSGRSKYMPHVGAKQLAKAAR